jgi:hemerythrin-like domain-containing protein
MNRRYFLGNVGVGAGLIFSGYAGAGGLSLPQLQTDTISKKDIKHQEVTAVEDLMREHGVLRRILFLYSEAVEKLRSDGGPSLLENLYKAAKLFQSFGEEYHEKKLEEDYIFPAITKLSGDIAAYPGILIAQHNRGREITDYILGVTNNPKLTFSDKEKLIVAISSFVRMYRPHAAREDTVIFPAWKDSLNDEDLDEMNDKFEEIEHQMFGEDGFENAVKQIAAIETEMGLADISKFTAGPIKT